MSDVIKFNVGQATQWDFADGLRVNPKADPETTGLAILILRQTARQSLCQGTPRGIIDKEFGGHCTHDGFYVHQVPLAYMVVFSQRRATNPGPPALNLTLYGPGYHGLIKLKII